MGSRFAFLPYSKYLLGGWRRIENESELKGGIDIAIEHGDFSKCYLAAIDNGKFTLGARHVCHGEPPNPEEILSLIKCPDEPKIRLEFNS